jgi:excisionase family DNA binding protein
MYNQNQPMYLVNAETLENLMRKIISEEIGILTKKINKIPKLLTREQAAKVMNVCPNTISEWIRSGRLQNRGIGRKILLMDSDLEGLSRRSYTKYTKAA